MVTARLAKIDWDATASSLTETGFALLPKLLSRPECKALISLYSRPELFRTRIDMAKFRFGQGEYQYFNYPLPPLVEALRHGIYTKLVKVANTWSELLRTGDEFPRDLETLLKFCHQRGQTRPTPLMLHYREGDFNCLHQDIYGEIAFPFQVVFFLSQPDQDYSGGEFLLTQQAPRSQAMGRALLPRLGDALVITTRYRPVQGKHGNYKVAVRHGVSPVTAGERWTLGIIFHDSK